MPTTAPSAPNGKLSIPGAAELDTATKVVAETFADDFSQATTMEQKAALSVRLRQMGSNETTDMPGKYVLLTRSIEIAIGADDLPNACKSINELAKTFQVEAAKMTGDAARTIWKSLPLGADFSGYAEATDSLADDAQATDQYELSKELESLALLAARRSKDTNLLSQATSADRQITEILAAFDRYVFSPPPAATPAWGG